MRSISTLAAIAIVMSISIVAAVFVSLYVTGIIGSSGFGTRPIKIQLFNPMVIGKVIAVMMKNVGGDRVYVTDVLMNNRECEVRLAFDANNPEEYVKVYPPGRELSEDPFKIDPGETVEVIIVSPIEFRAGMSYQVKIKTSQGFEFITQLYVPYVVPSKNYRINLIAFTNCNNTISGDGCCSKGLYPNNVTGISGHLISFDIASWRFYYWDIKNKDTTGFVTDPSKFILIGKGGTEGTLDNPPPPKYEGTVKVLTTSGYKCEELAGPPDGKPDKPTAPIVVVANIETELRNFNFTWINMNPSCVDRFMMEKIPNGIPGLDFLILWEDLWSSPNWWYTWRDCRSYVDHVVRVTWLKTGDVRVGVYRCSGCYLHVFLLGDKYIYFKPHGDAWGDTHEGTPDPYGIYWFTKNGVKIYYEIGYDGGTWISPSGYVVKIWEIRG